MTMRYRVHFGPSAYNDYTSDEYHSLAGSGMLDGLTVEELPPVYTLGDYVVAIDAHVDAVARQRAAGGAATLPSYKDSAVPAWAAEATTFMAWRDAVWIYVYGEWLKVVAGERSQPTPAELIAELDPIIWPEVI